jgi:hypothetical protein
VFNGLRYIARTGCPWRDYERLPRTLKALHFIAFAMLMSAKLINHFNATP